MRRWLTLGALVGAAACHPTIEVPAPELTPDSTVIFFQPSLERATWTVVDGDGQFAVAEQVLDPEEPWHVLTYDCSADVLDLPPTLKVETNLENSPILPNRLATWPPGGPWTDVPPPYEELATDIQDLNWQAPEICEARVGDVSYRTPPIPPDTLTDLTSFFSLGEDQDVFVSSSAGVAYTISKTAMVTRVPSLPGAVAAAYLGADDGQFYLLMYSGEIYRSNLEFETTRIAGGAIVEAADTINGSYRINKLFGSPDGKELLVLTSSGTYVYDGDDEWTRVRGPGRDFDDAIWIAPGEFFTFGGSQADTVLHLRRDGTIVRTWDGLRSPVRFHRLGERLYLSTFIGRVYEFIDGDWTLAYAQDGLNLPIREASTGGLILASITINLFDMTSRFGIYHPELDSVCLESSDASRIDGVLVEVAPLAQGIDAFASIRLRAMGLQAPVLRIRTQNIPPRRCGFEPAE